MHTDIKYKLVIKFSGHLCRKWQNKPMSLENHSMRKLISTNIIIIMVLSMLSACATATKVNCKTKIGVVDGMGNSVCLAAPAQKIVSISPSATETLFAIGAGNHVIGRDSLSDYPEEAQSVVDIGETTGTDFITAVVDLKPDLVVAGDEITIDQVAELQARGLTVYFINYPKDFEGLYQTIRNIGSLTGKDSEADDLVQSLAARVIKVQTDVKKITNQPVVYLELGATDPNNPVTSGRGTMTDLMISMTGGKNAGSSLKGNRAQISLDELIKQNPDLILLADSGDTGIGLAQIKARPGWSEIKAVKNSQIYSVNSDLFKIAGPRLVDGLELLLRLMHPELYRSTAN